MNKQGKIKPWKWLVLGSIVPWECAIAVDAWLEHLSPKDNLHFLRMSVSSHLNRLCLAQFSSLQRSSI